MPPKAKGGKKGAIVIEGVDTTEMTNPQLQQYMMQIYEKLLKEREERSFFQLERDKLRTYWEILNNQLNEARAQLRNKEYALELAEEKRLKDLNEVNQKVKYLQYEQGLQLTQAKVRAKEALVLAEKDFEEQQLELLADKKEMKSNIKTLEELHQQENKDLRLSHAEEKTDLRKDFDMKTDDLVHRFDRRITNLKNQLETKQKLELMEMEERKNTHVRNLTNNHNIAFNDIRNYYNNITLNNFSLITNMKSNIEDMKTKEAVKDKQLREVLKENKTLTDEMKKERAQMQALIHQLANYKKETMKIGSMKREMQKAKLALDKLTWDYEVLNIRYDNCTEEQQKVENERMYWVTEIQKDVGGRVSYLEEKVKAIKGQVDRREMLITDIRKTIQIARQMGEKSVLMRDLTNILGNYDDMRARRMTHRQSLFL